MKNIYVILSATPTKIGLMIRALTKGSYNHASISLTKDFSRMYSFARYRAKNPWVGGFIKEFPQRLTLGKDNNVQIKVFEIPVKDEDYNKIERFIYNVRDDEERCIYNSLAVIGRPFGKGHNTYKAYVCTDFVINALLSADMHFDKTLMTPGEIEELLEPYLCYQGRLEDYHPAPEQNESAIEEFFSREPISKEISQTAMHFYTLVQRSIKSHRA